MRIIFSLILSLLFFSLSAIDLSLKSQLQTAQAGSWIVLSIDKVYTLFYLRYIDEKSAILEEVTIGRTHLPLKKYLSWKNWFEQGAEGHSQWIISKINLQNAQFEQCYSPSHKRWVDPSQGNNFFSTLMNLHFTQIPIQQRKRIGHGAKIDRPIWEPKCVVEGSVINHVSFSAYQARWPADGSELAKKTIEIYVPYQASIPIPAFFPYWLEVEGKVGSAKARVIDSGFQARSPQPSFFEEIP